MSVQRVSSVLGHSTRRFHKHTTAVCTVVPSSLSGYRLSPSPPDIPPVPLESGCSPTPSRGQPIICSLTLQLCLFCLNGITQCVAPRVWFFPRSLMHGGIPLQGSAVWWFGWLSVPQICRRFRTHPSVEGHLSCIQGIHFSCFKMCPK